MKKATLPEDHTHILIDWQETACGLTGKDFQDCIIGDRDPYLSDCHICIRKYGRDA